MKKLNVGDWVRCTKVGVDGAYQITKIELDEYTCVQNDDGYKHTIVVTKDEIVRL